MFGQQPPIHDRVGGSGWNAQIVFEDHPIPWTIAHQIRAADVCTHRGRRQAAGRAESRGAVERKYADDTVGDDRLLGVDVDQKGIQGSCALPQACRQVCPFVGGDEPRHQIERKHLSATLPADPERDVFGALILLIPVHAASPTHRSSRYR